jgi:putative MATE family efflux protein
MNKNEALGTKPILKLLIEFSIPAIVGMMVNALYNIVDRIYVGYLGPLQITGIGLALPLMTILMGFGMLVGVGASARISISLGQKDLIKANKILGNAFVLLIIIMASVSIISLVFLDKLLIIFGASVDTFIYAKEYITVILLGSIFQGIGFGLNNSIRAEGNPKRAMNTMIIGAVANIILDPIFIFVLGLGIKGAAIATIISQGISAILVLHYFIKESSVTKLSLINMKLDKNIAIGIFTIGMSPFFMQIAASLVTVIANNSLKTYGGDIAIGAMTVINAIAIFFLMPIFGINQGVQPIIGYNYGAKNYDRVKKALKSAIIVGSAISVSGFLITQFFTVNLIRLFNDDVNLINTSNTGMKIFLSMMPLIGFQIISANYFQAVGKAKKSMILSMLRQVILLIPLLIFLPRFFALKGVWLAGPISDFIAAILTGYFILTEIKHLDIENSDS